MQKISYVGQGGGEPGIEEHKGMGRISERVELFDQVVSAAVHTIYRAIQE